MFLAECRGVDPTNVGRVLSGEQGTAAVKHLFCVAAGLDSMVLGEPQIVAQVKQAWQLAQESGTTGPLTGELFQAALRAAKRVTTETAVGRERLSIPSIAVADFASGVFERFDDKRVLLIGAGKMAAETLRYLRDAGAQNIRIINRSVERAHSLAQRLDAQAGDYNNISHELVDADLVVSTTGASEPVVTLDLFKISGRDVPLLFLILRFLATSIHELVPGRGFGFTQSMILVRPVIPIAVEDKNNFQQHSQLLMKKLVGSWEICTIDQPFQLLNNSERVGMKQVKSNLNDFSESFQILI
jgi:hypothetical protein